MRLRPLKHVVILAASFVSLSLIGAKCPVGLGIVALNDLHNKNVDKYVGDFVPATSDPVPGTDWVKHTYDTAAGNGPICINGTPFTVFTRFRDAHKLVIFLNGGGACWQNFYQCSTSASSAPPGPAGIFGDTDTGGTIANPFADYSMMFVSYCDGSVFTGDNTLADPAFTAGAGTRHHRGLRNVTAALDLARDTFPAASQVVLAGSSAGGFGVAGFSPFVFRFIFGNAVSLSILNDSGIAITNTAQTAAIAARVNDWQYMQFTPAGCTDCTLTSQPAELVDWMFENDPSVREAWYETDADLTIRFFLSIPTQVAFRSLMLTVHDPFVAKYPLRWKRYFRSGTTAHTILGSNLFFTANIGGQFFYQWVDDFANEDPGWIDIVEPLIPTTP